MILLKFSIYSCSALLLLVILATMVLGMRIRYQRRQGLFAPTAESIHPVFAKIYFSLTVVIVLLAECAYRIHYGFHFGSHARGFVLHFVGFDLPMAVLLPLAVFVVTGEKRRRWHKVIVYPLIGFTIGAVITDTMMVAYLK